MRAFLSSPYPAIAGAIQQEEYDLFEQRAANLVN
jgi:hypothetical protein